MLDLSHVFLVTTSAKSRTASIEFSGVDVQAVNSFDFRRRTIEELGTIADFSAFARRYGSLPTAGAVGCAAAHRYCYEKLIGSGGSMALIVEDDTRSRVPLKSIVEEVLLAGVRFDVCSLKMTLGVFEADSCAMTQYGNLHRATVFCFGAHAYLVTAECARRFLARQSPKLKHLADWPLEVWQFRALALDTDHVSLSGRPSTVEDGRTRVKGNARDRLVYQLRRFGWTFRYAYRARIIGDSLVRGCR